MLFKKQTWLEKEAEEKGLTVERYFELQKLEKENAELKALRLEQKIRELEGGKHECDAMCEGCQNLIEGRELYYPTGYGVTVCNPREMTTRRCALDRTCKDFKAKDCSEQITDAIIHSGILEGEKAE